MATVYPFYWACFNDCLVWLGPTLTGILPYAGLKFYIYEELKAHVPEEHQKSIMMRLSCGALAGLFGQTFTYPLDVVRRQMQVFSMTEAISLLQGGFWFDGGLICLLTG